MSDEKAIELARTMLEDENREFRNPEGWKLREPRCPKCNHVMKKTRRVVTAQIFYDKSYNLCLDPDCKPGDHTEEIPVAEVICANDDCKEERPHIPDLLHTEITLKCKCDMGDDVQFTQFQYHLTTAHGVTKGEFVQMMMDAKRPVAKRIAPGQDHVWLEKKRPSKKTTGNT